jgi:hypothetical protein
MRFFHAADKASRTGEAIGSAVAIAVVGLIAYIVFMSSPFLPMVRHLFGYA